MKLTEEQRTEIYNLVLLYNGAKIGLIELADRIEQIISILPQPVQEGGDNTIENAREWIDNRMGWKCTDFPERLDHIEYVDAVREMVEYAQLRTASLQSALNEANGEIQRLKMRVNELITIYSDDPQAKVD